MTKIIGTGSYLPKKVLTNKDLEKMVETSDEWITTRTGIKERRIAAPDEAASDLAVEAAKKAIAKAKIDKQDIELIIVATITPDMFCPSTACQVQTKLGIKQACAFDISAACTGFIYGLAIADSFIKVGVYKTAIVIASELLSRITDWEDRATCVLFGDGAGCAILRNEEGDSGIISCYLNGDGKYGDLLKMPAGGSLIPASIESVKQRLHYLKMKGSEVFKIAVHSMLDASNKTTQKAGISCSDLKVVIPHQANMRIIRALAKRLGVGMDKVFVNIHKYGNMSAATTAVGLDEAIEEKDIRPGDYIELVAFGGGFTWGGCVIRW